MPTSELYTSSLPLFAVLVSLAAVPLIVISRGSPNLREFWTLAAAVAKLGFVAALLPDALSNRSAETVLYEIVPGLSLALRADPLGVFFALVASSLWLATSFYSIGYMRELSERRQTRYFACFALCLSATVGIAFASNLLTFTIFYEILTIATYPLVIHKGTREALSSGRKYLVYTLSAGVLLIACVAMTYQLAGTVEFAPGGFLTPEDGSPALLRVLFLMFVASAGVKAGLMPFHSWLPAAMVAPTPVSALLHAVAVVKAGVFATIRIIGFVFGPTTLASLGIASVLATVAAVTILLASLLAFTQDNLKRRLAYSTVGHLSYIILGAALLTPTSLAGSLMHFASHALMKITLFFCAGAIYVNLHKEKVSDLDGIGRQMPLTMAAFAIGALGLAGVPPINGFSSKWYLGLGALEAGVPVALLVFLLSGLLNAGYFFPIVYRAFFRSSSGVLPYKEASWFMVAPLLVTGGLSLILGLAPNFAFGFFSLASLVGSSIGAW